MADQKSTRKGSRSSGEIPAAEWIAAVIGMALVALVVGATTYQALWGDHSAPDIVVEVQTVSKRASSYLVQFIAVNRGGAPAEGVVIEAVAGAGASAERSHTVLDYLPGHSERAGGLFFSADPGSNLRIRALGYEIP
jgi:uncharacterized protein (TIGR02588 family)